MNYVAIPLEVFESKEYLQLSASQREFLMRLYYLFGTTEHFSVDLNEPADYGETNRKSVDVKVRAVVRSGLIEVREAARYARQKSQPRVLAFKHSATSAYQ